MTEPTTPKSLDRFWKGPEGNATLFILGGLVILFWIFGSTIGDFMVHSVDNMLNLVVSSICIVALLAIVFDQKFRAAIFYMYRSILRMLLKPFFAVDSIGILKTYKSRLDDQMKQFDAGVSSLNGQKIMISRSIAANEESLRVEESKFKVAVKNNDERGKFVSGRQVERLTKEDARMTNDLSLIVQLLEKLNHYRDKCSDTLVDVQNEIASRQREQSYSQASRKAIRGAWGILHGLPEKEFYDEAIDTLESQYDEAIGEVTHFMDITKDIMASDQLSDAAAVERALARLEKSKTVEETLLKKKDKDTETIPDQDIPGQKAKA